jgi:phosphate transport system substrate-binding protein
MHDFHGGFLPGFLTSLLGLILSGIGAYNLHCLLMKRKAMDRFFHRYLLMLALTGILPSACGSVPATPSPSPTEQESFAPASSSVSIQINGAGATFPLPIYTDWTYAYSFADPTVAINYQGIGSGGGKKAIIQGTVDFAGSDLLLDDQEYAAGKDLQMYPILAGAVVIIYNIQPSKDFPPDSEVPRLALDRQTLVDIYNGTVNQWNDPKIVALNELLVDYLPEAAITAIHRSDASGTTELFTRSLVSFSPTWTAGSAATITWPVDTIGNGAGARGNQGVAEAVINIANTLGYVELSYAVSNNLAYADMINKAGNKVTANAESVASAINDFGTATFNDQLTATIVDGDGVGSWPISGYTYLILHQTDMTDCVKARKLLEYLHWTITNPSASARAAKRGYAVLPDAVRNLVLAKLDDVTCNGQPVMK